MQNAYSYDHTGKLILIQEPGDYDGCWTIRKTENDIRFFCYKERLLWMFESSLVCLEILADLTSFTSNSNDGFVREFSVAAAPQK